MKKVWIGVVLGAALGAIDGAGAWFYPAVRAVEGKVLFISFASSIKGLIAGLITGFIARKLRNLPLGMVTGFLVFALITLPVALGEDPDTHMKPFWEVMIPGSICGMIVGYATQRYGATARDPMTVPNAPTS